jgi:hypothetical protein
VFEEVPHTKETKLKFDKKVMERATYSGNGLPLGFIKHLKI